ncbi:MAG: alpha-amylase family glycosyl hydrolase [Acidobacteriaceae bacterium]
MTWWQRAVIYEVYPRSFQDSDGDGIGDLKGILERLDYLVSLGVDALWITPIYPSPMADFGYDVMDYCSIAPIFGTLSDFDRLLAEVHSRGLRMILDFVPNHTSDEHPWFVESRSSRTNPKRDWYLWRDEPNNWLSNFGGSAWEYDATTSQYYLHSFLKEQPDLNWRNPEVRTAMFATLRFWLERGVDGFRVDVMWLLIKDDLFRDNPPNPDYKPGGLESHKLLPLYTSNRPEVIRIVEEMRAFTDEFHDRVLIGEIYLPIEQLVTYYGQDLKGAQLPFNFQLLQCPWNAASLAHVIAQYDKALPPGAWPNWVLGNHDNSRIATRVGEAQAGVAAMLLLTLPGTITIYYGEELGLEDVSIAKSQVQDPAEKNEPGIGAGRDPERTPMPWDDSRNAGFTAGVPWLPVNTDYKERNVSALEANVSSALHLYRRLIALRRSHPVLVSGALLEVSAEGTLLRYQRADKNSQWLVLLNLGARSVKAATPPGTVVISTVSAKQGTIVSNPTALDANEGLILDCGPSSIIRS